MKHNAPMIKKLEIYPKGLHNVFDNRPEMKKFRSNELKRAIKYVVSQMKKNRNPIDTMNNAISSYGFTVGYEAFRLVNKYKNNNIENLPIFVKYR